MIRAFAGKKPFLIVAIVFGLLPVSLSAQNYPFTFFSENEGLPVTSIRSLCEDSRGFLWIGTDGGGLSLMDGNGIAPVDSAQPIDSKTIRALFRDSNNILWIGTDKGLVSYDGYAFRKIKGHDQEELQVMCLYEDTRSTLWIGTANQGCFYIKDQRLHPVKHLASKAIFDISEDSYGRIWLGSFGGGLYFLTMQPDTCVIERPDIVLYKHENAITSIEKIAEDEFLLGTYGSGIKHIKLNAPDECVMHDYQAGNIGRENIIIWDILQSTKQEIWIATDKHGVYRVNNDIITKFDNASGLKTNQVLKLYEDRQKNIWLGTNDKGVSLYLGDEFVLFDQQAFSTYPLTGILKVSAREFWISTYGGGVQRIMLDENQRVRNKGRIFPGLPEDYITALYRDSAGTSWLGTQQNGLYKIDKSKSTRISQDEGLILNKVNTLHEDHKGRLWCGTDAGISMIGPPGILNMSTSSEIRIINNEVQCFVEDRKGTLWIGTLGGLERIHGDKITDYGSPDGLANSEVLTMDLQYDSILWIGTKGGGLYRCLDYTDSIPIQKVHYKKENASENIRALKFLNDTILLAGTDRGITMYVLNAENDIVYMRNYDTQDGYFGGEVIQNGMEKLSANAMLIAANKGIVVFSPDIFNCKSIPVSVHIEQIDLFYNHMDWRAYSDSLLPYSNIPHTLKLKPHENFLSFHVATDNLSRKSELVFSYELSKREENWSPFQDAARFDFMNIPFGANVFRIKIEGEDDYYQDSQFTYAYEIKVPFYLQWWFYAMAFLFFTATVFVIIWYRERTLRKRNFILEDTVQRRTLEITWQKEQIEEQKGIIEKKNQDMTDSIRAAKYIQDAVLPPTHILNSIFSDSFIIYWPKDIVSGDFYWIKERKKDILIIAADCTGHGIPGAFMSLLGISFLNNMVDEANNDSPAEVLNKLRAEIIKSLNQGDEENTIRSGMDAALIAINKDALYVEYAGAYNPLILIRNKELIEFKADKMPIAYYDVMDPFTNHRMQLQKGDQLYFFSDGFADQFGGPDDKKIKRGTFYKWLLEVEGLPFKEQSAMLEKKFNSWKGTAARIDDVVLIGIKV